MINTIQLLLAITIITCFSAHAQGDFRSGYIVTLEKDTILGQVHYRSNLKNYESCVFNDGKGVTEHYPNDILGFGYDGDKFFSSQFIKGTFIEVLVVGDISLFKSKDKYHMRKDTSFFDLESVTEDVNIDGKIIRKEKNKWRGIITYLTGDCLTNSAGSIAGLKLDQKLLTKLVIKYNKCRNTEFTEYKTSKPWTKFDFGVTLGISQTNIPITERFRTFDYLDESYRSVDPTAGIIMAISAPRITEKVALQGEFHFLKASYSSLVRLERTFTEFHDTSIDLTTFSIPVSLKYSFHEKKYGLYLQGGINYDYHKNSKTKLLSERIAGNNVTTSPESPAFEINTNQVGYWGGIEILKPYPHFKASMAIRYFQMSPLNKTDGFTAKNNRISLNFILYI